MLPTSLAAIWGTRPDRSKYPPHPAELTVKILHQLQFHTKHTGLHALNSISVFPDPSFPQIRESSPCGKWRDRSTRRNLCFGVDATEDAWLPVARSCGQVAVHDWNATVFDWLASGGTAFTSALFRYFSMRRSETKPCGSVRSQPEFECVSMWGVGERTWSMLMKVSGRALSANFISLKTAGLCQ